MQFDKIKSIIDDLMPGAVVDVDEVAFPKALWIHPNSILNLCKALHSNQNLYFDSLSCLTGLDNGEEEKTIEIIYNLYSIPYNLHLMLKVKIDRERPEIDSVTEVWKTADWHEREVFDLLGVKFNNHPDLRRILLPDDWEGHPLRKDYVEQEKYHEVKVKY
ncbi:NADH-quinone oxidoreductase subunit C [Ekhidna sp.]|uniref:NADH-quinone oxidoreductase subunit C n=1 Tax=Ekhidna sp. TaxID=2608089 RepID=UPI003BAB6F40